MGMFNELDGLLGSCVQTVKILCQKVSHEVFQIDVVTFANRKRSRGAPPSGRYHHRKFINRLCNSINLEMAQTRGPHYMSMVQCCTEPAKLVLKNESVKSQFSTCNLSGIFSESKTYFSLLPPLLNVQDFAPTGVQENRVYAKKCVNIIKN